MLGLVNGPHPPLPNFLEQQVIPQDQRFSLPLPNLLGLKLRQFLLPHQFADQLFGVFGICLGGDEVFQRIAGQNPTVLEVLDELQERDGHPNRLGNAGSQGGLR